MLYNNHNSIRQYLTHIFFILGLFGSHTKGLSQSVYRTLKKLPDTGQNLSYTNTFGEDNDYSINPPHLKITSNTMVYDSVTTLQWQLGDGGEMTFDQAIKYCDTLTLGGFTDWRLPLPSEAFSILNHQNPNPAVDIKIFPKTGAEYWYTSTQQANDPSKTWVTNAGGGIGNHPKTETISAGGTKKFHARAVRSTLPDVYIANRFLDNGDGSVTDQLTDLMWVKSPGTTASTWEDAILLSEFNTTGGHTDWRLPNIKEIRSLNDETRTQPSVSTIAFPSIAQSKFWSSTTLPNQSSKAWYYDNQFGITSYDDKTASHLVWMVRTATTKASNQSIEANQSASFIIYPNPADQSLTIQSQFNIAIIEISNSLGQVIITIKNTNKISTSELPTGQYVLTIYYHNSQPVGRTIFLKN